MNPYTVIYRHAVRMPDSDFAEIVTDNADVASIRIGERINKYIQMDHIMDKMRSKIKEQTDGDPEEIISLQYVNEATPYSSEAFAKTYFLGLEKAEFSE